MSDHIADGGVQGLAAECANVVVDPDSYEAPQSMVGGANEVGAPFAANGPDPGSHELRLGICSDGLLPDHYQLAAVLAGAVSRLHLAYRHDKNRR